MERNQSMRKRENVKIRTRRRTERAIRGAFAPIARRHGITIL